MKKFFKLLLTFCICTGLILSAFSTVNAETSTSDTCGTNLTWTLDNNGTLTVSGTGEMSNFTSITMPWYSSRSSITSVVIQDGVTSIGDRAFMDCSSLNNVTIPNSVTNIGTSAFYGCNSLSSVTIPNSVTNIGTYAFYGCSSLSSVTIPNSVTSIGTYAFANCMAIKDIYYDGNETEWSEITSGNRVFSTTRLNIHYTNGTCGADLTWTLADGVLTISGEGTMDDWGSVYAPWYPSAAEITSVVIEDGVTGLGSYAFYGFSSLNSINIPEVITNISNAALCYCINLTSINVSENNPNYSTLDGNLFNKDKTTLVQYAIGKSASTYTIPDSVTSFDDYAFAYCTALTHITIPDNVIYIGERVFYGCSNLTSITVDESNPNYSSLDGNLFNKDKTTLIQYARGKTDASYTLPDSVTSIGTAAFCDCSNLNSIILSDKIISIGDMAFQYCTNLSSITLPDGVTNIGLQAFFGCSSLSSVTIPNSVTSIGNFAFYGCSSLSSVTIPNSVTSICRSVFYGCSNLNSIILSDKIINIGDMAFQYCTNLSSITLPDGVTNIGLQAFFGCSSLSSVTIPNSVTSIGNSAFSYCSALEDIYFGGTEEQWNGISLGYNNTALTNANIYYNCPYHSNMTTIFYDGATTDLHITPAAEYTGNVIACALYKNQILSDIKIFTYSGNALEYATAKPHDEIKIMVWKDLSSITPICEPEVISTSKW